MAEAKYTVQELEARHVGICIATTGACDEKNRWKIKNAVYMDEKVRGCYASLRDSIKVLLIRPNGYTENDKASMWAQVMIDNFLVRRAEGENVEMPKRLVPINAKPDDPKGIELFDAEDFTDESGVTENEKIRWVYESMRKDGVMPADAPSAGAYGMLIHYRETKARQEKFYDTMVPKLMSKEDATKGGKLEDSGKETIELLDRLIKAEEEK